MCSASFENTPFACMALSSFNRSLELYRNTVSYNINMVAKPNDDTAYENKESLGELNTMDNPPQIGIPPGFEQGIIDYINNAISNGIANANTQMNNDMQQLAQRLDDNAAGHFKSLQTQITDLDNKINALNAKVDGTKTAQYMNTSTSRQK